MDSVRGTAFLHVDKILDQRGASLRDYLAPHRIALEVVGDYEKRVSYRSLAQIFQGSAHALGMPEFGLELATRQGSTMIGPLRHLARSAATVGEGVESVLHYLRFYSPSIRYSLERQGDVTLLEFQNNLPCPTEVPQIIEKSVLHGCLMIGELLGAGFRPRAVLLRHPPQAGLVLYRRYFDCPVLFRQARNALVLDSADLCKPCVHHDPQLHAIVRFYLDAHCDPAGGLGEEVDQHIRNLLPRQRCCLEQVAQAMGMTSRTLQRRLEDEGVDFERRVDQLRRVQAEQLLRDSKLSVALIALELGYRCATSFSRAHYRWFGTTPSEHRRRFGQKAG
ncbi:AraC family transcriptional regulator [Pseudomonas sp. X10]